MVLTAQPECVVAADIQHVLVDRVVTVSVRCRTIASRAISSMPAPSIVLAVPVKHFSTNSVVSPTASKICAPQ